MCWLVQSEVNFLGRLSHPNLVRLLGYCGEDRELLLVYEFMSKGSLENHLFRSKQPAPASDPPALALRLIAIILFSTFRIRLAINVLVHSVYFYTVDELQW